MWILSAAYVSADILNILYAKLTKLLPWLKKKSQISEVGQVACSMCWWLIEVEG